jgi:hypothetical protein
MVWGCMLLPLYGCTKAQRNDRLVPQVLPREEE